MIEERKVLNRNIHIYNKKVIIMRYDIDNYSVVSYDSKDNEYEWLFDIDKHDSILNIVNMIKEELNIKDLKISIDFQLNTI